MIIFLLWRAQQKFYGIIVLLLVGLSPLALFYLFGIAQIKKELKQWLNPSRNMELLVQDGSMQFQLSKLLRQGL